MLLVSCNEMTAQQLSYLMWKLGFLVIAHITKFVLKCEELGVDLVTIQFFALVVVPQWSRSK